MIQRDNDDSMVAAQALERHRELAVFWHDADELLAQLRRSDLMAKLRDSVWRQRKEFTFDAHVDRLAASSVLRGGRGTST